MNNNILQKLFILMTLTTVVGATGWYCTWSALRSSEKQLIATELEPLLALLIEDSRLLTKLQAPPFTENDSGILQSYLVKWRRDGIVKTSEMKQLLNTLAENNTAISTLATAYLPHSKTLGFSRESTRFHAYSAAWRDRWDSSTELFMEGGNYPASSPVFTKELIVAVQAEIDGRK